MTEIISFKENFEKKLTPRLSEALRRLEIVKQAVRDMKGDGASVLTLAGPCYFDAMNDRNTTEVFKSFFSGTADYLLGIFESKEFVDSIKGQHFVELFEMAFAGEHESGIINVPIPIKAMTISIIMTRFQKSWFVTNIFFNHKSIHQTLLNDFMKKQGQSSAEFFNNWYNLPKDQQK